MTADNPNANAPGTPTAPHTGTPSVPCGSVGGLSGGGLSGGGTRNWYSPDALAAELGVSTQTVLGWIAHGDLEAVNVGRAAQAGKPRWRIAAGKVREFTRRRSSLGRVPTTSTPGNAQGEGPSVRAPNSRCRVRRYTAPGN
jgi:hypothetical protein